MLTTSKIEVTDGQPRLDRKAAVPAGAAPTYARRRRKAAVAAGAKALRLGGAECAALVLLRAVCGLSEGNARKLPAPAVFVRLNGNSDLKDAAGSASTTVATDWVPSPAPPASAQLPPWAPQLTAPASNPLPRNPPPLPRIPSRAAHCRPRIRLSPDANGRPGWGPGGLAGWDCSAVRSHTYARAARARGVASPVTARVRRESR
ncbi:hypothetical protein SEVIR_9G266738v4 [Setaria viridis]